MKTPQELFRTTFARLCRACPKSFELGGLALAALLAALLAVGVTPALAVHNEGLFELGDGAATLTPGSADIVGVGGVVAPCDWTDLFDAASQMSASPIAGSVALCGGITASFLADQIAAGSATDDTTFAGGTGSDKNDHLINTWHWTTASVPAKDDVGNAYLFAVTAPANSGSILVGDLIVYAGIERISANGDSHIDIELNQAVIGLDNSPPCPAPPCSFVVPTDSPPTLVGGRTINDVLINMDFSNGGKFGALVVRKWDGTQWVVAETLTSEGCTSDDLICAVNNGSAISGTLNSGLWDNFDQHGAVTTTIDRNGFTEMGFDLSRLLGLASTQVLCLNTVQVKTRSSDSFTSELKDFVLGRFVTCSSSVSTEIHSGSNSATPPHPKIADETTPGSIVVGSTIHDLATVTGTAGVELVGQVTFRLFGNTNPTCNPAGTAPTLLGPFALPSGSGNIKSVESSDVPNVPPGALAFQAVYHDTRSPAIFPDSTSGCEQLTVFKRNAIIVTQILDAAGNDITGTTVFAATSAHDKATVSCTPIASCVGAPTPTGTVIFRRFSTTNCSGTPVDVQTVALSAGVAETSPPISVTIPGLSFNASYVDDAVYNAAGPSVCEPLTVIKRECTVTTAVLSGGINVTNSLVPVGTVIVDQANIAGSGPAPIPTPAGGTVTFTRFSSGNCTGSIDLVTTALLSGGVASSPTFTMPSNAFSYVVTYDGTNDPNYNNCGATVCEPVCALQARTLP